MKDMKNYILMKVKEKQKWKNKSNKYRNNLVAEGMEYKDIRIKVNEYEISKLEE